MMKVIFFLSVTVSWHLPRPIPTPNKRPPLPAQRTAWVVVAMVGLRRLVMTNTVTNTLQAVTFILSNV